MPQDTQPKGPVTVLHAFGRMDRGGAELRTLEVLRNLEPSSFQSLIVSLSGQAGTLDEAVRLAGGQVLYCRLGWSFPRRFRRLLRAHDVDVVHAHVHHFSGVLLLLARLESVRVRVAHLRTESDGHDSSVRRLLQRWVMRWLLEHSATRILAVGEGAMAAWRTDWPSDPRCEVLPNGLDLAPFRVRTDSVGVRRDLGVPDGATLLLHVGRPIASKNRPRALEVLAELHRAAPQRPIALAFVGARVAEDDARLQDTARRLGVEQHFVLAGERDDVPRLLKGADLLVVPSEREGLPGVVLEAWAAGTPVLASDLPGIREIERHTDLVMTLSLAAPSSDWAAAGEELLGRDHSDDARDKALTAFGASPFSLETSLTRLSEIWRGA